MKKQYSISSCIGECIDIMLKEREVRAVTYFLEPKFKVRVGRMYRLGNQRNDNFRLTFGGLNYRENEKYKKTDCMPFIQKWFYPKKSK